MANHGTTQALVDGGYIKFQAAILEQLPRDIDPVTMKAWVKNQAGLKKVLREALVPPVQTVESAPTFPQTGIDWLRVYCELGLEAEFTAALPTLPQEVKADYWWVPVITGVTSNKIVACLRKLKVDVYLYTDNLDAAVSKNDRDPKDGAYVVHFRQIIEADPELRNKSADDLKKQKIAGITLTERLLLELAFFLQTGDHLDKENVTLCSGSRYSHGSVPYVGWYADYRRLYVSWCYTSYRYPRLRARAVS